MKRFTKLTAAAAIVAAGLLLALLPGVCRAAGGDEQSPLVLTADTPWIVAADQPEPVARALEDVKSDWYKVLGHLPVVLSEPPASWTGPVVYLGKLGAGWKELVKNPPAGAESFLLCAQRDAGGRRAIVATGADTRGTIYAAYALSEELLGVDPWYYWVDKDPAYRGRIEVPARLERRFGKPTFQYRGWFINDEDLLGGYAPDPLRENVFSLEMWERICETLLRLRCNLLVPGTFTFPDERCYELASRRGLVLNTHHILVVGLNTYRWPKDVPFSYSKHPEIMERYWQTCIDAFHGREVVWTVGYRGKHDRPFWVDEPELKTPEARGAVMTRAIARQVELIRKADPQAAIIANLWMEGVELIQAGHLKLPAGVIQVWPDDGSGVIRDNGAVRAGQGIYYHTAMLNSRANQLSEMVNPGRIAGEMGRFARAGATRFFLVNVSDVRPVPLSTDFAMRFAWDATPWLGRSDRQNMDAFLLDWSRRQFGAEVAPDVAALYAQYFDIPYQRDDVRHGENDLFKRLRDLDRAAPITAGKRVGKRLAARVQETLELTGQNRPQVADLVARAEWLTPHVPPERQSFYQAHVIVPARIHLHGLEMLEHYAQSLAAYARGDKPQAAVRLEESLQACDALSAAMRRAETGKWARWFIGERFVGLDFTRDRLRATLAALRGEPVPPLRSARGYPELYQYQERFGQNFPLLYPRDKSR
jgi:hypothetical protein